MIKRSFTSVLSVAAIAALALAGCSSKTANDAEQSAAESAVAAANAAQSEQLTITKTPESISGGQVMLPIKRNLLFTVKADAEKWTASIADPSIAEFIAGDAATPPTIHPLAEGETTVDLTGPDGTTISFALIVTPGAR
ncbi:hypothetical protein [Schaalia hyovaginalis]|uniref:hypothetical protein n=1 Tax=Schaalia hyovaginalis TaxID=29316 RepID=UPI002A84051D|nr:hypothetical protein [Schaalia hyovaginalis]MDY4491693.1 hypothetical protein [Schaalia hyovaginalis]